MFQVSGNTYQYETLSVYHTHKHISVTKFVNSNKQPQTIKLVNISNLLVLGLNRGSPSEEKTSMKKHFLMGHCFRLVVIPINMKLCLCIIPINIFQLQSL